MNDHLRGLLLVLSAALTWSLAGVGIKSIDADALVISGYRSLFAIPVFLIALLATSRDLPALLVFSLRRPFLLAGALAYALTVTCFVIANKLTTAANAILLQYTAPVYVALLSWPLIGERLRRRDLLATFGCLSGMAWFFADRLSPSGFIGNLVAVLSGVGFGFLPLMLRLEQSRLAGMPDGERSAERLRLSPLVTILFGNVLSLGVALPFMARLPGPRAVPGWAMLVFLGVVQIGVAYLLFVTGARRVRAIEALLVATIEPILNPLWVALLTTERPGRHTLIGGVLILLSVAAHGLLSERERRLEGAGARQRPAPPPASHAPP